MPLKSKDFEQNLKINIIFIQHYLLNVLFSIKHFMKLIIKINKNPLKVNGPWTWTREEK